ncbi:MAG: aminopeptidase N [Myxococcales bacterium]
MKDSTPVVIHREDYRPSPYTIERVDLVFELDEESTVVRAKSSVVRTPGATADAPLVLDGQDMTLVSVSIDGRLLAPGDYTLAAETLTLPSVPARFTLEIAGKLSPVRNKALEGLYVSGGNFCTQCEAEGFRRITWFLDRPDVMARYTTRIEADKRRYPQLLSNGNLVESGELAGGRHFALWEDPFPKPCYLFALVAGNLVARTDHFTTRSGRVVTLKVFVAEEHLDQTEHCMASLKRAMKWDEEVFGREYDLDIYMIVAVRDFNMGAMENKGLNVFNTKYVLARPDTATDLDFSNVEAVVAHEYFHNWSGNRVTCRDWFQLSLKEGFTVFRDQEFSSDVGSRALKRIQDVQRLFATQFPEDAGPTAHPIRPDSYVEINNFYTPTVYEKGAEVVRMLKTLLGPEKFRKGTDLYFERHDGQAATCDDFVNALEDASAEDLSQFRRWYSQAGTPTVSARGQYDGLRKEYRLELSQRHAPTPGQDTKHALQIPIVMGLLGPDGKDLPLKIRGDQAAPATTRLVQLREASTEVVFTDVPAQPTPSLLRGFSAPVRLEDESSDDDLLLRMAHDSDAFCRWDAAQALAHRRIAAVLEALAAGRAPSLDEPFVAAFGRALSSQADPQLLAQALALPAEGVLADRLDSVDPGLVHDARAYVERTLGMAHRELFLARYQALADRGPFSLTPAAMGARSLRNLCLRYLFAASEMRDGSLPVAQFDAATNMTDMVAALGCVVHLETDGRRTVLERFYQRFQHEALVVDKWFFLQSTSQRAALLHEELPQLLAHPAFSLENPNRARSLIDGFATANPYRFHDPSGAGYRFLRERVLQIDPFNPQVAARMVAPLTRFARFEPKRRELMVAELTQMLDAGKLSRDLYEQVSKALRAAGRNV